MQMAAKTYQTQFLMGAKVQTSMGKAFGAVQKNMRGIQNQAARSQRALSGMSGGLKKLVGFAAGYVGARAIFNFFKEGVDLASDLVEVQNVVDATFQKSAGQINSWSKSALKNYGLSQLQAKQYTGTMGAMLKSSGISINKLTEMSTTLAGLTGDIASFYNLDHEAAFGKIRSGISGETEPLKQLGINMSVANLEAYAKLKGIRKAWAKMSQSEQVSLRYNYILKATKDVQGDFEKTSKEYANQLRIWNTNIKQFSAGVASRFLPLLNKGIVKMNELFEGDLPQKITGIADKMVVGAKWVIENWDKIRPIVEAVTVAIVANKVAMIALVAAQKAGMIIKGLSTAWLAAQIAIDMVRKGQTLAAAAQWLLNTAMLACPAAWIAAAIMGIVVAGYYLIKNWDKVSKFLGKSWEWLKKVFAQVWSVFDNKYIQAALLVFMPFIGLPVIIAKNWGTIKPFFIKLWSSTKAIFVKSWNFIWGLFDNKYVQTALMIFAPFIGLPVVIIKNWGQIKSFFGVLWEGIKISASGIGIFFKQMFSGIVQQFKSSINIWLSILNFVISNINKMQINIPDWVPTIGGKTFGFNIPQIPMLAKGTNYFQGGLAMVGERGRELVNLPRGSSVAPNNRTESILSSMTGGAQRFNVTYAPQYNIQGNADREVLEQVNQKAQDDFGRKFDALLGNRNRLSFV
jgi:hypothetical protein